MQQKCHHLHTNFQSISEQIIQVTKSVESEIFVPTPTRGKSNAMTNSATSKYLLEASDRIRDTLKHGIVVNAATCLSHAFSLISSNMQESVCCYFVSHTFRI